MSDVERDEQAIFETAIEIADASERAAYLQQACSGDAELLARIERLVKVHEQAGSFLERPALEAAGAAGHGAQSSFSAGDPAEAATVSFDWSGETGRPSIGPYKLLQEIGQGGMGVVFMAEQTEPVRRRVAVKIIKPGMDSKEVLARFEAERQALAMMDHPNIARVLDAGTTDDGRPFFVMELVKGVPITDYCDRNRLSVRERLELFIPVCYAIQHAHQKGIIHRDIKPTNIMVALYDGKPVPKVIDFGVAKAIQQPVVQRTLFTQYGQIVGTLEYMSPEQAELNQLDVDTRSDVYSLGVVLYELLTGTTPITKERIRQAGLVAMLSLIQEYEPERPSTRVSHSDEARAELSAQRQSEPEKLARLLRGDLDWIVLKALEKDRSRRYASAADLARDIERYLAGEPVEAAPPSLGYKLRKYARRHRAALATVAAFAFFLIAATAISTWQAVRATRAERTALAERDKAVKAKAEARDERDKAQAATRAEANAREQAQAESRRALRHYYVAQMNLAQRDWEQADVAHLLDRLEATRPEHTGGEDLRGFEWYYWDRQCHPELMTFTEHTGPVTSVAYSPDGKRLATAGWDGTVNVWEVAGGKKVLTLTYNNGSDAFEVLCVAFSPDGNCLAAAGKGPVRIWDVTSGEEKLTLEGHLDGVSSVAFNPNGNRLAAALWFIGEIKVWDISLATAGAARAQEKLTLMTRPVGVATVAFSPDGNRLASAGGILGESGAVTVWDVPSGQVSLTLKGHTDLAFGVAFSPDGKHLASASKDGTVKLWDLASGRDVLTLKGHTNWVLSVAFSPDGKHLASASLDDTVKLWDVATGQQVLTLKGHTLPVLRVAFSPDGKRVATASADGTVKVWDLFAPRSGAPRDYEKHTLPLHEDLPAMAFSPDARRLASASHTIVKVWDLSAAQAGSAVGQMVLRLKGHRSDVNSVAFSPDGNHLASASYEGTVKVWKLSSVQARAASGREVLTLKGAGVTVAFSPDGKRLASAGSDGVVKLWDVQSGRALLTFKGGHARWVYSVAFSPNGKRLATASDGGPIQLWDVDSGQELLTLKGHKYSVRNVAFSPDGKRLASAGGDVDERIGGELKLWDVNTGQELFTLHGHTGPVWRVAFSPDGKRLASAGSDGVVKLWDCASGQEVLTLKGPSEGVISVAFSPDGKRLASAGGDLGKLSQVHVGQVKVWDARPWTPELKVEYEALGLVRFLFDYKKLPKPQALEWIEKDQTITEAVRQKALEFASQRQD